MTAVDVDLGTKPCTKCRGDKPVAEFHRDRSRRDGLSAWCKACTKASALRRYEALAAGEIEVPHGDPSTYTNYRCRCVPCTEAHARKLRATRTADPASQREYQRRWRARRRSIAVQPPGSDPTCGTCIHDPGYCEAHQVPPVCVCDQPDETPGCQRCNHRHLLGTCHRCHRPVGERFATIRRAWREHLSREAA